MNLTTLFATPQLTSLLHESDTELALSCLDPQTGSVTRVTVKADMVALPDEALLFVEVKPEGTDLGPPPEYPTTIEEAADVAHVFYDEPLPRGEPDVPWSITPRGEEIDLREVKGGLW